MWCNKCVGYGLLVVLLVVPGHEHAALRDTTATFSGQVRVLASSSGALQARRLTDQVPSAVAIDARTGRAFILTYPSDGTGPRHILVIATRTGALVHTVALPGPLNAVVAVTTTNRVLVADGRTIRLLDSRTGALLSPIVLPCHGIPQGLAAAPLFRRVFVDYGDGSLTTLDAETGVVLHSSNLGGALTIAVHERTGHVLVVGRDINTGRPLVVSMLDAATGGIVHRSYLHRMPHGGAISARAEHVFAIDGNIIDMIDARTGRIERSVRVSIHPWSLAESTELGRVYVLTGAYFDAESNPNEPGTVSTLDVHTGIIVRSVTLGKAAFEPSPSAIAVDPGTKRVWVLSTDAHRFGGVSVLNADTGALLYTVHPARNALPAAIAVDSQAERLIEADVVLKG